MKRTTQRLGMSGYVAILRLFVDAPTTVAGVVASGVGATAAKRITKALHTMRLIHIAHWIVLPHMPVHPAFSFGNRPDAPLEVVRPNGRPASPRPKATAGLPCDLVAFRSLIAALQTPASVTEACERTGMCWTPVDRALRALHAHRLIRVAAWRIKPQGGPYVPLYQFAIDQDDAPKPPATKQARNARYRQRVRAQAELTGHLRQLAASASVFAWRPNA